MTHRPSFPIPGTDNEFYIEQHYADGTAWIYDTRTENAASTLTREMVNKFMVHINEGYHADCVICQQDPRTPAQKDADQHAAEWRETYQSQLP